MGKALKRTWVVGRIGVCCIIPLLNAIAIGYQGNGNLLFSGVLIGVVLGMAWAVLLLFGVPALVQEFQFSVRVTLLGVLLISALILLPLFCARAWGHGVTFMWWPNSYWP